MRKPAFYFVAMIFAMQSIAAFAQAPRPGEARPAPGFTLTISEYHHEFGPALNRLSVKETNISNEVITEPGCMERHGLFSVSVVYNGAPLEEKDAPARRLRENQARDMGCTSELGINPIKPGESRTHWVSVAAIYDVSKPGTYEITVSRETDPDHPEKSVTVRSNTLTVVVPEPEADAPK
ncbi:MAG: hypothetical protein ACLP7O_03020 [Terracidiphilus sp.]